MAAELPQGTAEKELPLPALGAQEGHLKVYHRCAKRHLRVLESKIARQVIQLNDELKAKVSSMGLSQALPSCSGLLEERERTIAKRDAVYAAIKQQMKEGDGAATPVAPSAGM